MSHNASNALSINLLTFFLYSSGLSLYISPASTLAGEFIFGSDSIDTIEINTSSGVNIGLHLIQYEIKYYRVSGGSCSLTSS